MNKLTLNYKNFGVKKLSISMSKVFLFLLLITTHFIFAQKTKFELINTSINSKYAELGVILLKDNTILFSSSKKTSTDVNFVKNRRRNNRNLFLDLYKGIIDNNGNIIQSEKFENDINS